MLTMPLVIFLVSCSSFEDLSSYLSYTLKEKLNQFELSFIFCDTEHTFYLIDAKDMKAKTFSSGAYKKSPQLSLSKDAFIQKSMFSSSEHRSIVLNLIHGADGEDGLSRDGPAGRSRRGQQGQEHQTRPH